MTSTSAASTAAPVSGRRSTGTGRDGSPVYLKDVWPSAEEIRATMAAALQPDLLLAWAMNGEDLPWLNGYPLRLIVPGYYGTYWIKHLNGLKAKYPNAYDPGDGSVIKPQYVIEQLWDATKGECIIAKGTQIRPGDAGMLAILAKSFVFVYQRPRVAILSTGDELADLDERFSEEKIIKDFSDRLPK